MQHHQVEIGIGRDVAPPVTAVGNERHLAAQRLELQVVERGVEQREDDRVEQLGKAGADLRRGGTALVLLLQLFAPVG
jgi:hypothetical protein